MYCKIQPPWILPSLMSLTMLFVISYNIPIATAIQDSANFLTYTNTNLGFTIKHPSDWTVNDRNNNNNTVNVHKVVSFTSPDSVGIIFVQIQNATQYEIAVYNMNDFAKINTI